MRRTLGTMLKKNVYQNRKEMKSLKLKVFFLICTIISRATLAQMVSFPSNCMELGFYFQEKELKFDTSKIITLSEENIEKFFYSDDSSLGLTVVFKNLCQQNISIPNWVRLDMPEDADFSIEAHKIGDTGNDTLNFYMEYDWREEADVTSLQSGKLKVLKYPYPLWFYPKGKGIYRFRLRFLSMYCNRASQEWDYYYSNWIRLEIL
mgnify:FL=1